MAKLRVFVVEDEALILLGIELMLEENGLELAGSATSAATAIALAKTIEADVALLDINLRDETSFSVADVLVARGIPVIFMTGNSGTLPPRFAAIPRLLKPCLYDVVLRALKQAAVASPTRQKQVSLVDGKVSKAPLRPSAVALV